MVSANPSPATYRARRGLAGTALTAHCIGVLDAAIARLAARGVGCAGLMFCTIFANEDLPDGPPGCMQRAVDTVHPLVASSSAPKYKRAWVFYFNTFGRDPVSCAVGGHRTGE